jgi:hypothetical protein
MSRRFSIVKPEDLWTGPRARELRKKPSDVRELFAYLLTGPSSDRWGIWHLELDTLVLQLGRKDPAILAAFAALSELDLAHYDLGTQFVYVPSMPESQFVRWPLLPKDNNVRHAKRWYAALPRNPFLGRWFDRHCEDMSLDQEPEAVTRRDWTPRGEAMPALPTLPTEPLPVAPAPAELTRAVDLLGEVRTVPMLSSRERRAGVMTASEIDAAFKKIVDIYPKKDALDRSRKALHKLKPTPELMTLIFAALQWQVQQPDWLKEGATYAPRLDRYFVDKRWLDQPRRIPRASKETMDTMAGMVDFAQEMEAERWKTPPTKSSDLRKR